MQPEASAPPHPSDAILERLKALHPRVIDLSLERIQALLRRLGDPHQRIPPVVHVAGTNGKGSVVAFLRAILEAAGHAVHVYTSPHLVRFNERIRVAGRLIEEAALAALLAECERVNAGRPITLFEITTAAAFLAFARTQADVTLLEVGLGGRLDATNVVARPLVTAITPVSLDHQHYLGDTIAAIAGEKAGILKAGVPCVSAVQPPEAARVIAARAAELGVPLHREGHEWSVRREGDAIAFAGGSCQALLPLPALLGAHQVQNAGAALACVSHLAGLAIPEAALAAGLRRVEWPARLQRLTRGPLVSRLPAGWELWLDGGHNPAAAAAIAAFARGWRDRPLHLIVGMLNTKDTRGFLEPLVPLAGAVVAIGIPGEANTRPPEEVAALARGLGADAEPASSAGAALTHLAAREGPAARVLISGSLYLAGTVLRDNG